MEVHRFALMIALNISIVADCGIHLLAPVGRGELATLVGIHVLAIVGRGEFSSGPVANSILISWVVGTLSRPMFVISATRTRRVRLSIGSIDRRPLPAGDDHLARAARLLGGLGAVVSSEVARALPPPLLLPSALPVAADLLISGTNHKANVQRWAIRWSPGCENLLVKLRQSGRQVQE